MTVVFTMESSKEGTSSNSSVYYEKWDVVQSYLGYGRAHGCLFTTGKLSQYMINQT